MSSAIISGCGKLTCNNNDDKLFLNIIQIPVADASIPTQIMFLAHKYVTNFSDFLEVLDYYTEKNGNLQICGGEWVESTTSATYTYVIEYIYYYNNTEDIRIMYKGNVNTHNSKSLAIKTNPPTTWVYFNV